MLATLRMRVRFSDDRGGERHERRDGRSAGRKQVIPSATWDGAFAAVGSVRVVR